MSSLPNSSPDTPSPLLDHDKPIPCADGQFKCPLLGCDYSAMSKRGAKVHFAKTHTEAKLPFPCPQCYRSFSSLQYLQYHQTSAHPKYSGTPVASNARCPICMNIFSRVSICQKHLRKSTSRFTTGISFHSQYLTRHHSSHPGVPLLP